MQEVHNAWLNERFKEINDYFRIVMLDKEKTVEEFYKRKMKPPYPWVGEFGLNVYLLMKNSEC